MTKCELCETEVEELYMCDRCGINVCLDCIGNECPYSITLCKVCDSDFVCMCEGWLDYKQEMEGEDGNQ